MINLCACLGPQHGEKYCPCVMEKYGLERSIEWQQANSPEQLAKTKAALADVLEKVFKDERTN